MKICLLVSGRVDLLHLAEPPQGGWEKNENFLPRWLAFRKHTNLELQTTMF